MNYYLMNVMQEYTPEFDQMLYYLPLAGSAFKKVYYDAALDRPVSTFIQATDLIGVNDLIYQLFLAYASGSISWLSSPLASWRVPRYY